LKFAEKLSEARKIVLEAASAAKPFHSLCAPEGKFAKRLDPTKMSRDELVEVCKRRGLALNGSKSMLLERFKKSQNPGTVDLDSVAENGLNMKIKQKAALKRKIGVITSLKPKMLSHRKGNGIFQSLQTRAGRKVSFTQKLSGANSTFLVTDLDGALDSSQDSSSASMRQNGSRGFLALESREASASEALAEKITAGENFSIEHVALVDDSSAALMSQERQLKKRKAAITNVPEGSEKMQVFPCHIERLVTYHTEAVLHSLRQRQGLLWLRMGQWQV